jgi:erythromycin esterase
MKLPYWVLLPGLLAQQAQGQAVIKSYVQRTQVPIASIQPGFTDDADLAAIGQAIGQARVVMLGEQDHGDGATFLAKTRLVKYLHEQKGFTVLAFEGDFFALNQGWESLPKEAAKMAAFLYKNIYPYWSDCRECDELLYTYLPQTYRTAMPLRVAGFDNQLYASFSRRVLPGYLDSYLAQQGVAYGGSRTYQTFWRPFLDTLSQPWRFSRKPATALIADKPGKLRRFVAGLDTIWQQLPPASRGTYGGRLLENLGVLARESAVFTEDDNATDSIRDAQMARNLDWLVNEKYPHDKILVWAASSHVAKGPGSAYQQPRVITRMGVHFMAKPENVRQTYVLGFSSKWGMTRRVQAAQPTAVKRPPKDSFETWINNGLPYAFVDFKEFHAQFPQSTEFFWLAGPHHEHELADWTAVYDGIFFIREMTPCGKSEFKPASN